MGIVVDRDLNETLYDSFSFYSQELGMSKLCLTLNVENTSVIQIAFNIAFYEGINLDVYCNL